MLRTLLALLTVFSGLVLAGCPGPVSTPAPVPTIIPTATLTPEQTRTEAVQFARDMLALRQAHNMLEDSFFEFSAVMPQTSPDVAIEKLAEFLEESARLNDRMLEMKRPSARSAGLVYDLHLQAFKKEREALGELFRGLAFGDLKRVDTADALAQEAKQLFQQGNGALQDLLKEFAVPPSEFNP